MSSPEALCAIKTKWTWQQQWVFSRRNVLPDDALALHAHSEARQILAALAFSPKCSLLLVLYKKKSIVFMANLHNWVCWAPIPGPKERISRPQSVVIRQHRLITLDSQDLDISPISQFCENLGDIPVSKCSYIRQESRKVKLKNKWASMQAAFPYKLNIGLQYVPTAEMKEKKE